MIVISEFFPRLMPYVIGCSEPMAAQALVDSAIAFCNDSLASRMLLTAPQTQVNNPQISITMPADLAISRVLRVWVSGSEISGAPVDWVNDALIATGQPGMFYTRQVDPGMQVLLYPTPDAVYATRIELATRPTRAAASLANDLFDLWLEPIIEGAKARLMAIPDQPFTNPRIAISAAAAAMYLSRRARIEASYGRVRASSRVQMRPLA